MIITSRVSDKLATTSKVLAKHKIFAGEEFIGVEKIHLLYSKVKMWPKPREAPFLALLAASGQITVQLCALNAR